MEADLIEAINRDFTPEESRFVKEELLAINLNHVMAASAYNLKNTRAAILYLAKGNLKEIKKLTATAKIDFRNVIMWATQDKKSAG